jgi:ribosomal protein S18 acetylase RimI-like enzyme
MEEPGLEMVFDPSAGLRRGVSLRPMVETDLPFIAELYASTRREELAASRWPESMQRAFLAQQHEAQHRHYRGAFATAEWLIVERDSVPVGRLYLDWTGEDVRVIDISLVPEARGRGLGAALLRDLQGQAKARGRGVTLSVRQGNPARRLYERLGFVPAPGLDNVYDEMIWRG